MSEKPYKAWVDVSMDDYEEVCEIADRQTKAVANLLKKVKRLEEENRELSDSLQLIKDENLQLENQNEELMGVIEDYENNGCEHL